MATQLKASNKTNTIEFVKWAITLFIPLIIYLTPMDITNEMRMFLCITSFGILAWITIIIPVEYVGVMIPVMYLLFNVIPGEQVFSPWNNSVVWGTLAALLVGLTAINTGLSQRIAYWALLKMNTSLRGLIWGFAFAGIILTFLVKDGMVKVSILMSIAIGICQALDIPAKSKEGTALGLAAFFAFSGPSIGLLTGGNGLYANSALEESMGISATWMQWFYHNFIPCLAWTAVSCLCIIWVLKIPKTSSYNAKDELQQRYNELGKITLKEIYTLVILLIIVALFITKPLHGYDPLYLMVLFVPIYFMPKVEILNGKDFEAIDVKILFVIAGAMSIGVAAKSVGLVDILIQSVAPLIAGSPTRMIIGTWIFMAIANFFLTPLAIIFTFTGLFGEMALNAGIDPLAIMYTITYGSDIYVFPYEYAILLFAMGFGYMNYKEVVKVLIPRCIGGFLMMSLIVIPYWNLIGLL